VGLGGGWVRVCQQAAAIRIWRWRRGAPQRRVQQLEASRNPHTHTHTPQPPPHPTSHLQAATKKQKYEKISERKMKTPFETLCKGFPQEFVLYFQYVR